MGLPTLMNTIGNVDARRFAATEALPVHGLHRLRPDEPVFAAHTVQVKACQAREVREAHAEAPGRSDPAEIKTERFR